jgi:signal transduction histidine kinase
VSIQLGFDPKSTVLVVTNEPGPKGAVPGDLGGTGGGFGLVGMRERIELLGGEVVAAPSPTGWTVQVAVPV